MSTDDAETQPEPPQPSPRRNLGKRFVSRLSIQSKLLLMLLVTSIVSVSVVGFIGYQSGRESLRESVFERLTEIRGLQARGLEAQFTDLKNSLLIYTRGSTTTEAVQDFTAGFDQLQARPVDPQQWQAILDYYNNQFAPAELAQNGTEVNVETVLPVTNAQKYLQFHYSTPFADWDKSIEFDDAGDGSAWSAANAKYNEFFRGIVQRFDFEDALLLDTRGNVVYTAYKGVDLGTNILTGPYRENSLRDAYQQAMSANSIDYVGVTDFSDYQPASEPTAWMVSPIGDNGQVEGVLALQFPISKINRMMTFDRQWEAAGMGRTGETILVGPDGLMRSDSRLFLENQAEFLKEVVDAGTPPEVAQASVGQRGTTLVQPVDSEATRLAQRGQTGTIIEPDYLGHDTLQSYAPLTLPGLNWSVIAKIDTDEAFAPVAAFTRTVVLSTTIIIFVVSLAAMLLARLFVRPIRRLEAGAQQISSGDYHVALPVRTRDEFGDLTVAFNDMSRNLSIKEELLAEQRRENDRLMLSLMPEQVAQRYRDGEETIAEDHQNVTVIFADIVGLDELAESLTSEKLLAIVNRLTQQFDAAAMNLGVEQVRTLHNGYLASCGLSAPRLDNVRRTVDFAVEMQRIVERFDAETGHDLKLHAGIDTGTVASGLVGRSTLAYDMWGSAVNLAYRAQSVSATPGIFVTDRVHEAMSGARTFTTAGTITVDGHEQAIWQLAERRP